MNPQTFLDAAELIETHRQNCCCYALDNLESSKCVAERFFCNVFAPIEGVDYRKGSYNAFWMSMGCTAAESRARRVFALCMAATLAADKSFLSSGVLREKP